MYSCCRNQIINKCFDMHRESTHLYVAKSTIVRDAVKFKSDSTKTLFFQDQILPTEDKKK